MEKIKVIIIDDERAARNEIKRALLSYPAFEVTGEAKNADEAKAQIEAKYPDLIFLDIRMPEKSGFDLLESLKETPQVIFTTAFDQYAVKAFEINALDYLLKPIREERFAKAMERVQAILEARTEAIQTRQVFIKEGERCYFIQLKEVYLIESLDNYARLYFGDKKVLMKTSLNQLERRLDKRLFFRINRAQIINTDFIKEIFPASKGRIKISLKTGELLNVSDRQSVKFKKRAGW